MNHPNWDGDDWLIVAICVLGVLALAGVFLFCALPGAC